MASSIQKDQIGKQPRWQFRKKKKIEKRRKKRQTLAEKNKPMISDTPSKSTEESITEKQNYEKEKAQWEEKERKFKLIEMAKAKTKQKEQEARVLAQKRWQETLMNLPLLPPKFNSSQEPNISTKIPAASPMKAFVRSEQDQQARMTYRDRFIERKKTKENHRKN